MDINVNMGQPTVITRAEATSLFFDPDRFGFFCFKFDGSGSTVGFRSSAVQDLDVCTTVAGFYTNIPFGDTCPYYEDAVMCGIDMLDLLNDNVTTETVQTGRTWANTLLSDKQCEPNFDDIFDEVKAAPQLLKVQECIGEPNTTALTGQSEICSQIEEAVRCAIQEMGLYKEDASDSDMTFAREAATRYLSPISCPKTFNDILTEVKGAAVAEPCLRLAQFLIPLNPVSACAYYEDAVRCGIDTLDLYGENATVNEVNLEYIMNTADQLLSQSNCPKSFEAIFNETKASPQLLKLQQCYAKALEKGLQNLTESCSYVEEAVTCGIEVLDLYQENASDEMLLFARETATRYLSPFGCTKTFDDILTEVKGAAVAEPCLRLAQFLIPLNPVSTCAYYEDAVRCGIDTLDLYGENATVNEVNLEYIVNIADQLLSQSNCPKSFEAIFNETKASPQLLKLQQCYAKALEKGLQNLTESCSYVEEAVTCGIEVLDLHQENASDEMLLFGREMATRYLEPFNCTKTFDKILDEVIDSGTTATTPPADKGDGNSSSTVSPIGWLTAMMVVFIAVLKPVA